MDRDTKQAEHKIREYLERDEKLIWTGIPRRGLTLRPGDALMIPFSLLWGGFAIYWEYSVINIGGPIFMVIFGIPFVVIGLYMIFGRFFYEAAARKNTMYGITQDRILILSGLFSRSVESHNINTLQTATLTEKPNGSGTIVLAAESKMHAMFRGSSWPGMGNKLAPALDMIPDARKVYRLITELQSGKINAASL